MGYPFGREAFVAVMQTCNNAIEAEVQRGGKGSRVRAEAIESIKFELAEVLLHPEDIPPLLLPILLHPNEDGPADRTAPAEPRGNAHCVGLDDLPAEPTD